MPPPALREALLHNLDSIEQRIRAACTRANRPRDSVRLIAVTKSAPDDVLPLLPELGILDVAENRPQELWRKAALLPHARWHLIGHLQRNKVERTLPLTVMMHSADSLRLIQALEAEAARLHLSPEVLIEVNTSAETTKHGFSPAELPALAPSLQNLQHIKIRGLMTMAAPVENPQDARPAFTLLRQLRDDLAPLLPQRHQLDHLSMGMTNDFEIAIEEGATLLRIGSALFADLPTSSG